MAAPVITSPLIALTAINKPFSYQIAATNTPTSYGAVGLPTGLTVNTTNGVISGTPTAIGTSEVTLEAINADGTGEATLELEIGTGLGAPIIPPPPIGQGIGSTPPFPPPSIPPPAGPLVGPAVSPAAVPPSTAGIAQPVFKTGSATAPAVTTFFPSFSVSAWPVPPVQTTLVPPPTMLTTLPSPVKANGINYP